MSLQSVNPVTGECMQRFAEWGPSQVESALESAATAAAGWRHSPLAERAALLHTVADILRTHQGEYAQIITQEMGKPQTEARAEIEKCAWVCSFYAEQGPALLADEPVATDARRSFIALEPLGPVLAIMPWNFPFWQVFRFAAPAIMAGNVGLLKHASNVPGCGQALAQVWQEAGAGPGLFTYLPIRATRLEQVVRDPRVRAVTLTGSEAAGRAIAAMAGRYLKKTVLELGGSDAFIVLHDADLDAAAASAAQSRFLNCGQSCIAAKRFIVEADIADSFLERFQAQVEALRVGDPALPETQMGPLARADLRATLEEQIHDALQHGAHSRTGGHAIAGPGYFFQPTILEGITPDMRVHQEEVFGPAALVVRAASPEAACRAANDSPYGLGGSLWSQDLERAEKLARSLECGSVFINGLVKSDPRLPFGGIKTSGYGRELSHYGLKEFLNIKTVWIR
ncbi:MAG TPA: NAD-dependent succinate-semialdehyde dehydrogenase [Acidiferrobacteraceae bacterium]|nr:NAD-dependent succinate-semialdehyde dehydrogenase [Acidiferrobacteraceae bacterium]